jgi:hypothetical protein
MQVMARVEGTVEDSLGAKCCDYSRFPRIMLVLTWDHET